VVGPGKGNGVFTVEGPEKGNGVPCFKLGEGEQDEVTKLNNINMYDHYRNTELANVASCLGMAVQLGICGGGRQQLLAVKQY
jgi:hypothetical protein